MQPVYSRCVTGPARRCNFGVRIELDMIRRPDGSRLFAVHVLGQVVSVVDLQTGHVLSSISLPAEPYTCVVAPDGTTLFVSLWGGARVLMFDAPQRHEERREIGRAHV